MSQASFAEFTPEARKRWEKVPQWAREKILESVWCGNCLTGTPIQVRVGKMENKCLILEGTCKICRRDVVRLVEQMQ